ncbi:hypothetical protein PoB_000239100 [Plakobranchus ocellatus]|uniref:Uncharacterized protein n=1 Tax=Plakobranchus ocellatus TaxID=259542 RepID=A0AAV3XYI3_9GAST|nr:hypothetical protein PoB_000239100 [Plakobranchus ocellatus]
MNDLAASSSFKVNCSTSSMESSNDNLHRSPKRFQSALLKSKTRYIHVIIKIRHQAYKYRKMIAAAQIGVGSAETFGGDGREATARRSQRSNDRKFALQNLE